MVREPQHQDQLQTMVFAFFKDYRIPRLLKRCNVSKQTGIAVSDVFRIIFSLVFTHRSLNRWLKQSESAGFAKDTMYRFLNSPRHNWRRFLLLLSASVIQRISRLTADDRADVFIVDDSLFSRRRSKKVERLARVYDHVSHQFVRGFRMLTLGWSDGNSFVPLAFYYSVPRTNAIVYVVWKIPSTSALAAISAGERACKRQQMLCSSC